MPPILCWATEQINTSCYVNGMCVEYFLHKQCIYRNYCVQEGGHGQELDPYGVGMRKSRQVCRCEYYSKVYIGLFQVISAAVIHALGP